MKGSWYSLNRKSKIESNSTIPAPQVGVKATLTVLPGSESGLNDRGNPGGLGWERGQDR